MSRGDKFKKKARPIRDSGVFHWCWITPCILSIFTFSTVLAEGTSTPRPVMQASELSTTPKLDGMVLDDPAWQGVVAASGFWQVQPYEGQAATQKTEVYIGFIDDALYIGMVAYDDNPDNIIVTDGRRDSSLDETDSFRVIIDGLLDRQNGFIFGTNPVGMEYDAQVVKEAAAGAFGSDGFNLNWDASWSVVMARVKTRYGASISREISGTTMKSCTGRPCHGNITSIACPRPAP